MEVSDLAQICFIIRNEEMKPITIALNFYAKGCLENVQRSRQVLRVSGA